MASIGAIEAAQHVRDLHRDLAVADRDLRQPCRSRGRSAGQSAGGDPAGHPDRHPKTPQDSTDDGSVFLDPGYPAPVVGDRVFVAAGEVIPGDGDVIEGAATVDESAITGESAAVIREAGGDRTAVTGGTPVLSDQILVVITAAPGETFLDRMIALVEGASRRKTPNEIALSILLSSLTPDLPAGGGHRGPDGGLCR